MKHKMNRRTPTPFRTAGLCIVALTAGSAFSQAAFAQDREYRYAVFDLGELSGDAANGWGVSDAGHVVGSAFLENNYDFHAVIFEADGPRDLGTFGGLRSSARGVNSSGTVVGWAAMPSNEFIMAFRWEGNELDNLGALGGESSAAFAINEEGTIVGRAHTVDGDSHACMWDANGITDLGSFKNVSYALDINNLGQIVGWSQFQNGITAVLWQNGEMIDLGGLVGSAGEAYGINDLGNITGWSFDAKAHYQAVVWSGGQVFDISPKGAGIKWSRGWAINNDNQVVGAIQLYGDQRIWGFLWDQDNGMRLLNDLVPPNSPLRIDTVYDINNHGQIAGFGEEQFGNKWFRAVLITPVDPEFTLSDPVPGVAGQMNTWTIIGAQPGSKVVFTYSLKGGGTVVPGCDKLDAVLQINNPKIMKSAIADANGEATIQMYVPPAAKNAGDILFQAVSVKDCEESQLVVFSFE